VLGPLDTSKLGFTLSHEHVLISSAGVSQVYPEFIDRENTIRLAITDLKQAYGEGLRTIVDLTTMDLGRDVEALEQVSRNSGVNIICATGTWLDIPRVFSNATPEIIAPLYVKEITSGIENTNIKAGIIKVANDAGGVTKKGEIILRAAAKAQKLTGVPISTHTYAPERTGEQQIKIFEEEGVDLNQVCIGHSNDSSDLNYLKGLAREGVWVGLDRYPTGLPNSPDWERRTEILKDLIEAGFVDRIMLGHDWDVTLTIANKEDTENQRKANPDSYLFITRRVLPKLKELGVSNEDIQRMVVENPLRFFENLK
jgi:phosphotriesterase-related protein